MTFASSTCLASAKPTVSISHLSHLSCRCHSLDQLEFPEYNCHSATLANCDSGRLNNESSEGQEPENSGVLGNEMQWTVP